MNLLHTTPYSLSDKKLGSPFDWPFFFGCALCALPTLLPTYPAMVDIPQHAAQIESIKNIWLNNWEYSHLFEITYIIPYWIGYLFCMILSLFIGPVWSIKFVIAAASFSLPWFSYKFLSLYQLPKQLRWLLLITPFGFAYYWGFLNFLVSIPIGFLVLSKILPQNKSKIACLKNILWVHLLFFAHILTAAVFCAVATFLMIAPWNGFKNWLYRILPQISVFPILLLYIYFNISSETVNLPIYWDMGWHRLLNFPIFFSGHTNFIPSLIITIALLASPLFLGNKYHTNLVYFIPFILYLAIMLVSPHYIMSNSYNYHRFSFIGYPFYLLCFNYNYINQETPKKIISFITPIFLSIALAMLGFHTFRTLAFSRESADYMPTISAAEPGKRMLIFTIDRYSAISDSTPLYLHFPSWYQAETKGLVDLSFASMYQLIEYKNKKSYPIQPGFEWDPSSFDWQIHHGDTYDYFIFRSLENPVLWFQERAPCKVQLIAQNGAWWLFERIKSPSSSDCSATS